jgi:hypothetical protein
VSWNEQGFWKQGSYGFWEVLEIDNKFFQDLESFGKLIFGPLGYGKVMDFFKLVFTALSCVIACCRIVLHW